MEVAPRTLREVEFREKLRGYNQDDVDEFLERVAAGIEVLQERLRQANERVGRAEARLTELPEDDDTLRRTLMLAQRTADLAVKEAQDQAADIMSRARAEAAALVGEAEETNRRLTDEAERGVRAEVTRLADLRGQLEADVESLKSHLETERSRVQRTLTNALHWIEENVESPLAAPPLHPVDVPPAASPPPAPPPPQPSPEPAAAETSDADRSGSVFDAEAMEGEGLENTDILSRQPRF